VIVSSSAMQWSNDLDRLLYNLTISANEIYAGLFTSNTFKTIHRLSGKSSPILDTQTIKKAFSNYFECEFELHSYNLEFDSKKELFDYIKNSGVSGGSDFLSFKDAKRLYKEYDLNHLEFEVIFVKAFSRL
jgi:malonyl-CoA O-methyltransferase